MLSFPSPFSGGQALRVAAALVGVVVCLSTARAQELQYPKTRKVNHTDTYFGTVVADPYRWLEDDRSPETAAWVAAENRVTNSYLDKIPYRTQIKARLQQRINYPRYSSPSKHGNLFTFYKNSGLQNQAVLYGQQG